MITAVDSNVLVDVFKAIPPFAVMSSTALKRCIREGSLIASEAVWAEVSGRFVSSAEVRDTLRELGVAFQAMDEESAFVAGRVWKRYRKAGGKRERVLADFLIGAHAMVHADRLLTRDRGYYRTYFPDLVVIDASQEPGSVR